jgi:hypothetical protein
VTGAPAGRLAAALVVGACLSLGARSARAGEPGIDAAAPAAPVVPTTAYDHSLDPPPPPPRLAAKLLIGGGAGFILGGFVGTVVSPGCATHDARGGCLDARGSHPVFPVMMAAGLVLTVVGSALWRQDAPAPP